MNRRQVFIAIVGALVTFVASGVTTFSVVRIASGGGTPEPVECGGYLCIPSLRAEAVINSLQAQGHHCGADGREWVCQLQAGAVRYQMRIHEESGGVAEPWFDITKPQAVQPTERMLDYMTWVAALPFADDAATTADIRNWLRQQIRDAKDSTAKIAGYTYAVRASNRRDIGLSVKGIRPDGS